MDFFVISLAFFFISVLSLLSISNSNKSKKLPPGPPRLPIIGNLHCLGKNPHQSLAELAKIYGPIMSLKLGRITTIVISSSSAAKEVLQKRDLVFCNRHIPDALQVHNHSKLSVTWLPVASQWRSLRKLMTTNIFSINRLDANERLRTQKIRELIDYCHESSKTGQPVDIGRAAFTTTLNSLSNTIFSKDLTDPSYHDSANELKKLVSDMMVEAGKPNLVDYFPFPILKKIDLQGIRRRMSSHFEKAIDLTDGLINERMESRKLNLTDGFGDVLDSCLNTAISHESPEEIDRLVIRHMFLDLFAAGTDTTSSTVEWAMSELVCNQDIMTKAKSELELIIGKGKILEEANVSQLPYLQCIVKETLRIHTPVPLLIPRTVESDVELNGFIVPKNSQLLVNVWAIGRDPVCWEDPLSFKPERFLSSERDVRGQDFELLPFGAGRRICPGLPLAIRMVPVMLGSLINLFEWKLDGGIGPKELDMDERFGMTLLKARPLRVVPIPIIV